MESAEIVTRASIDEGHAQVRAMRRRQALVPFDRDVVFFHGTSGRAREGAGRGEDHQKRDSCRHGEKHREEPGGDRPLTQCQWL